ncbi:MAG: D-2-hydroxyacid dehydrogenase [Acidobacteriia bacterium]|nr:D-2-hydroxyacid dehydrogenase [Terriglobia bacterium]
MPITLLVTADPGSSYLQPLEKLPAGVDLIVSRDREKVLAAAPNADVLLNGDFRDASLFLETFPRATRLRWAHVVAAGVESVLTPEIRNSPIPLTNGRGVFARPLGEWAVGAMIFFAYQFRKILDQQQAVLWERYEHEELYGRTVAIVGHGSIGRAVGERAAAFGMRVLTSSRSQPGDLDTMLAACDYLVVTAPLTPETRGLIGAPRLARMKKSAVIINVGRGPVIDESALIEALQNGRLRGAALDVFAKEPLPSDHPFWKMDNVLLSPHTADNLPNSRELAVEFFVENFERFRKGEPLQNVVNKHAGY